MARSQNWLTRRTRGTIGDVVVKNYRYGQVLARPRRKSIIPPSARQLFNQARWKDAAAYYRRVLGDPLLFTVYSGALPRFRKQGYPLNALTNRDFFNPPEVDEIDLGGYTGRADQLITICAMDDFSVATVEVTLRDVAGNVLEAGPAWQGDSEFRWFFRTKTDPPAGPVMFEVVAKDLPGNSALRTETWRPAIANEPPISNPSCPSVVSAPTVSDFDPRAD